MTSPFDFIRQSLARKISSGILLFVLVVFVAALGYLTYQSREMVRQEAFQHAERVLENTTLRVVGYLNEVETATHNIDWLLLSNLEPDSLLAFSHRVVELNENICGCSITMEPDFFPQCGHYFSANSIRRADSITTVREAAYDYYSKVWYKNPREAGKPVWVDPYDDYNEGTLSAEELIASYCEPLFDGSGRFIGIISTDLSLPWLSKTISAEKPYPNSYCLMLGHDGRYFVHPEADRLVKTTIFTDVDPNVQPDLITLGHEMLEGNKGVLKTEADGVTYIVFYQPVQQTGWSIALVCPEQDIFAGYNRLIYVIVPLIILGLLLLAFYCSRTVNHFIAPVNKLALQARSIADGHFGEHMPRTDRPDVVGHLQNNFATMQQSLDEHISYLRMVNVETEKRNQELQRAAELATEADRKKTAFLQDMSHQIRTPLNIILGFMQVLRDDYHQISKAESENITDTMLENATSVNRMVNMLIAASYVYRKKKAECRDHVSCNELASAAALWFNQCPPRRVPLTVDSEVPDSMHILTNRNYLSKALSEVLYNAKKFTTEGCIVLRIRTGARVVRFIVEDTGPGIPLDARDHIFTQFTKLDDFGQGLGLGLSISRQFVRMMGGNITLDTSYVHGARFVIEVPREEE